MEVGLKVAGRTFGIEADEAIVRAVEATLPHHCLAGANEKPGHVKIRITRRADRDREWRSLVRHSDLDEWELAFGAGALDDVPNRFYYLAFLPSLKAVLAELCTPSFHGALLVLPSGRSVLLLGDAGAGKTTTAAACALAGGAFLSDDVVFIEPATMLWHGLRRPLHVHPTAFEWLGELPALGEAQPYLPTREKVAYDWWAMNPSCRPDPVSELDVVLACQPTDAAPAVTIVEPTPLSAAAMLASAAEIEVVGLEELCVRATEGRTVAAVVRWGCDVWESSGGPVQVLEEIARDGVRSPV